jgi:hypothetical protein
MFKVKSEEYDGCNAVEFGMISPKRRWISTKIHLVTVHKMLLLLVTAVRTLILIELRVLQ